MTATLGEIGAALGVAPDREPGTVIIDVTHDSRAVGPSSLFCCVPGATVDGHRFAASAVDAGAAGLLVERPLGLGVPELVVDDVRAVMGVAASLVQGEPSAALTVIGVTGTNGKSSVVQILADIWHRADQRAEILGTLSGARTTPEAPDLQRTLAGAADAGVSMVAMEVSSHALSLSRVAGVRFAAAIFTNLGRDHLDFHHDIESYFEAKALLFQPALTPVAVVNRDDPYGARLIAELADDGQPACLSYGIDDVADLEIDGPESRFTWRGRAVTLHLPGRHNIANALAAATTATALGVAEQTVADALCETRPVRGRFELVDTGRPFLVAVDYAHTPDALAAVLAAGRDITSRRVIVVFGCGGDRDQDKRPEMGRVAQQGADLVIVTSDNPRNEDPAVIIDAVIAGMKPGDDPAITVEPDRRRAIAYALAEAGPGDLVLLAGKGHETVQVIGDETIPFDDRAVALDVLGALA